MQGRVLSRVSWLAGIAAAAMVSLTSGLAHADPIVAPGFDLFESDPGATTFGGAPFTGVALGAYDFGTGPLLVGTTDAIIQRQAAAVVAAPPATAPTIPIELVSLQLRSVAPIDLGAGTDYYYITLQSDRAPSFDGLPVGPASTGSMDITFNDLESGTFTSQINVAFDVRLGSLKGPIVQSATLPLSNTGQGWNEVAPPGATILLPGINYLLKGDGTDDQDFWPFGSDPTYANGIQLLEESHPTGAMHTVGDPHPLPDPIPFNLNDVGNWNVQREVLFPADDPNSLFGVPKLLKQEVATDLGPFDLEIKVLNIPESSTGPVKIELEKDVVNASGFDWTDFHMELGFGTGDNFVPISGTPLAGLLSFGDAPPPADVSGAFDLTGFGPGTQWYDGSLPQGGIANFWMLICIDPLLDELDGTLDGMTTFTLRQYATVPEPASGLLMFAGLALIQAAALRRRA